MNRFALVVFVAAVFGGCQCFVPVDERRRPDGGAQDAGPGRDAGPECALAADCAKPKDGGYPFCPAARASCVDGRCLTECAAARTCAVADGGLCLSCQAPGLTECSLCIRARVCTFQVSTAECAGHFENGAQLTVGASGIGTQCGGLITPGDGGAAVGNWQDLGMGHALLWIPELGGYCTGQSLATGAPRMLVGCPDCTFVEVGCE